MQLYALHLVQLYKFMQKTEQVKHTTKKSAVDLGEDILSKCWELKVFKW